MSITVDTFKQASSNGRYIRRATVVTVDREEVRFTERLSKAEAIRSALAIIARRRRDG